MHRHLHLTVIAKEPRPGFVKTRLCPPCTPDQAAALAAAALDDTLDAVDAAVAAIRTAAPNRSITPTLLFDGDPSRWIRPGWRALTQSDGDLGDRLAAGFDDLGAGMIVGMEAAEAIPALVGAAAAVADGVDVLGLAVDGGYWVIGLGTADRAVFGAVPMSTSRTGLAQLRRLHQLGRRVRMLPMAHDLDTFDDVRTAARCQPDTRLGMLARQVIEDS